MLVDALVKANGFLGISSCISDPAEFWKVKNLYSAILLSIGFIYFMGTVFRTIL